jgi:hypothetical protein
MIWAVLYLLCIPGFACLYTSFPNDAWQYSTIMNERRHRDSIETFEQATASWLERTSGPMLISALQQVGMGKPDQLSYFIRYDAKLNPTLEVLAEYNSPRSFAKLWFSLENAQVSSVPFVFSNFYRFQALCEDEKKTCIATRAQDALGAANNFEVTEDIKERFRQLRDEDEGRSTGRTFNTFVRTLYLSAVTITTVGYGDIVPLTDAARAAVASEAIIGIMLIGLFLNALAYERDRPSDDGNSDKANGSEA